MYCVRQRHSTRLLYGYMVYAFASRSSDHTRQYYEDQSATATIALSRQKWVCGVTRNPDSPLK